MIIEDDNFDIEIDRSILGIKKIQESDLIIEFKPNRVLNNKNLKSPILENSHKSPNINKSPQPPQLANSSRIDHKKPSFMEYYNSISKDTGSSTNILEKYIRSKRG